MDASHDIVDIGVNLAHRSFQADRKEVIGRAFAAGVQTLIVTGTSLAGSQEAQRIAREYPGQLFATAGVHPHDSRNCTEDTILELRRLATHREVAAMGLPSPRFAVVRGRFTDLVLMKCSRFIIK